MAVDGTAIEFDGAYDGSVQYVSVPDSASLDLTNAMTLEAWISPDVTSSEMIINKENSYEFAILGGTLQWAIERTGSGGWFWHNTGYSVDSNEWTHVALTFDSTTDLVNTYANGELVDSFEYTSQSGNIQTSNHTLRIGNRTNSNSTPFDGQMDEVRIWNTARTAEEIQSSMNAVLDGSESGLAGYWKFDESSGNTVVDSSSNGNDGTLVNGPIRTNVEAERTLAEDGSLNLRHISIMDPDSVLDPSIELQATASVEHGTLTLGATAGLTISGNGTDSVTFTGTQSEVNAGLHDISYEPDANYNGNDTLTISVNDQGNLGVQAQVHRG